VEEICRFVEAQNVCNFDYLVFVLSAAVIACLGLATNSAAVVVAAMLISPLMGPIVGTLSAVTHTVISTTTDLHQRLTVSCA
jgi:uncharacterized membrane protein